MRLGLDFDNTLVCYEGLFHEVAVEEGLVPSQPVLSKVALRDLLRSQGREESWTRLQGRVYGPEMRRAQPFEGLGAALATLAERGYQLLVVSHRTRHPVLGPPHDLHELAAEWLRAQELPLLGWHFELTREAKLSRIGALGCAAFVDDLPEVFADRAFPEGVRQFLFDPGAHHREQSGTWERLERWSQLPSRL